MPFVNWAEENKHNIALVVVILEVEKMTRHVDEVGWMCHIITSHWVVGWMHFIHVNS